MIPNQENLFINTGSCTDADPVSLRDWLAGAASLPCITLWQPWATWIVRGWKTIETRTHPRFECLQGKRIGIHAGLKIDDSPLVIQNNYLTREQILYKPEEVIQGYLIGSALVDDFRRCTKLDSREALIDCEYSMRWGLVLSDIRRAPTPIKIKGAQGIWTYRVAASSND
jgi:hypothetical protein